MSLDTVVNDIRETAEEEAERIIAEAEEEAEEIIAEAEEEAEGVVAEAEREVEREIERERDQKISSANLEAKQRRLEARRDLLADILDAVEERIASLEGDRREELTRALLDAAAAEFDDDAVSVYGRADDEALLESILEEYDGFSYAGEYDCLGGVVVESETSRLRVNNTFDSVLDTVWDDNLRAVSDRLFDASESETGDTDASEG